MRLLPSVSLSRLAIVCAGLAGGIATVTLLSQSTDDREIPVCGGDSLADPDPTAEPSLEDQAAALPHHLTVDTTPSGATVIVNDEVVGKTPFRGVLEDRSLDLDIQIRRDGHVPIYLPVDVVDSFARCDQGFCLALDEDLERSSTEPVGDFPPHP